MNDEIYEIVVTAHDHEFRPGNPFFRFDTSQRISRTSLRLPSFSQSALGADIEQDMSKLFAKTFKSDPSSINMISEKHWYDLFGVYYEHKKAQLEIIGMTGKHIKFMMERITMQANKLYDPNICDQIPEYIINTVSNAKEVFRELWKFLYVGSLFKPFYDHLNNNFTGRYNSQAPIYVILYLLDGNTSNLKSWWKTEITPLYSANIMQPQNAINIYSFCKRISKLRKPQVAGVNIVVFKESSIMGMIMSFTMILPYYQQIGDIKTRDFYISMIILLFSLAMIHDIIMTTNIAQAINNLFIYFGMVCNKIKSIYISTIFYSQLFAFTIIQIAVSNILVAINFTLEYNENTIKQIITDITTVETPFIYGVYTELKQHLDHAYYNSLKIQQGSAQNSTNLLDKDGVVIENSFILKLPFIEDVTHKLLDISTIYKSYSYCHTIKEILDDSIEKKYYARANANKKLVYQIKAEQDNQNYTYVLEISTSIDFDETVNSSGKLLEYTPKQKDEEKEEDEADEADEADVTSATGNIDDQMFDAFIKQYLPAPTTTTTTTPTTTPTTTTTTTPTTTTTTTITTPTTTTPISTTTTTTTTTTMKPTKTTKQTKSVLTRDQIFNNSAKERTGLAIISELEHYRVVLSSGFFESLSPHQAVHLIDDIINKYNKMPLTDENIDHKNEEIMRVIYLNNLTNNAIRSEIVGLKMNDKVAFKKYELAFREAALMTSDSSPSTGSGLFDIFRGERTWAGPSARDVIQQYGDWIIVNISVCRNPIMNAFQSAMNAISFGGFNSSMKKQGYDKMFHLYMIVDIIDTNNVMKRVLLERNHVVKIQVFENIPKKAIDCIHIEAYPIRFDYFILHPAELYGNAFWTYDAVTRNCQNFILTILNAHELLSPSITSFVKQDVDNILAGYPRLLVKALTQLAGVGDRVLYGSGE